MLRPVTPGHVAVRPRPTAQRPGAWCIVTVGPVKHYVNVLEVDGNPADPQVLLHCYGFVNRDVALYAARLILRNGWLHTCDEPYPDDLTEAQKNRCIHPLGHEGMHGNGYYRWTAEGWVPTDYGFHPIEFERGELKMWDGRPAYARKLLPEVFERPKRCEAIDPDTEEKCHQKPADHKGWHQARNGNTWHTDSSCPPKPDLDPARCRLWAHIPGGSVTQCVYHLGHSGLCKFSTFPDPGLKPQDRDHWWAR